MSLQRLNEIVNGKRGITAETALLLGQAFGQSPEYWMNLQMSYDLTRARPRARRVPKLKARVA
jgi:addiction module HigA family antidote